MTVAEEERRLRRTPAGQQASFAARISRFLGIDRSTAVPVLSSSLVVSMGILVPVVSYPSLVFSGSLQEFSGIGVGLGLVSAVILTLALVVGGSIPGTVGAGQSEPAVVLGVVVAAMAAQLQASGASERLLPTVAVMMAIASLAVGAVFLLLGRLRMGNLIRFVPYPVIVGFIGGMGWLLIGGAVRVVTGLPLSFVDAASLIEMPMLLRWLPALIAGVGLWFLQHRRPHALNVPLTALGIVGCFWVVVLASGTPVADLVSDGWMLAPVPPLNSWLPIHRIVMAGDVDWHLLQSHWPQLLTLMTVSLMGVLMQASVIEIAARTDVDLNGELRALGAGNVLGAFVGSLAGYHSLSTSLLSVRMGHPTRATGLVVAIVILLILCFGREAIGWLPKALIGGLLFFVGLDVLSSAILNTHLRRSRPEYAVGMLVFAVVAFVGLIEGLGVGVGAGLVLFVVNYSQVDVVRRESTAVDHHSNVVRSARARAMLDELGGRVIILELQGYVFFGTSNLLLRRIRARLGDQPSPSHILLDFRRVTGIDSSVTLSFDKLQQYAQTYGLTLIATALAPSLRSAFERPGPGHATSSPIRIFPDLDHGLEFAENRLLATATSNTPKEETLEQQLIQTGGEPHEIAVLMGWLDRCTYAAGEKLIRQGETSDDIFYVERGAVTIQLVIPDGRVVRLRTMGAGTVVGEIAVYLRLPRSASVVAIEDTVAVRLSGKTLAALRRENPSGAALLHAYLARQLAEKLTATTRQLGAAQS